MGSITILTVVSLPGHEHGMFSILFMSFIISFSRVLLYWVYKSSSCLVIFIHKYFILFDAIVNGIVFLISFSDCSLLAYRNGWFLFVSFTSCNFAELV